MVVRCFIFILNFGKIIAGTSKVFVGLLNDIVELNIIYPIYEWDKYDIAIVNSYTNNRYNYTSTTFDQTGSVIFHSEYTFTNDKGYVGGGNGTGGNSYKALMDAINAGCVWYINTKYACYHIDNAYDMGVINTIRFHANYLYTCDVNSSKERGEYLETVTSKDKNEFPTDGIQGEYWYILKSI